MEDFEEELEEEQLCATEDEINVINIPDCYKTKIELIKSSGIPDQGAAIICLYIGQFPYYHRYFGGVYVAS